MARTASTKEIVEFGLESIPENRVVEVSVRDLVYVNQLLGELNRFFHQPFHHKEPASLVQFLGTVSNGGAYEALHTAYYSKLRAMLPPDLERQIEEGQFDHPDPPHYYGPAA
jgi:hypothetical protein